MNDYFNEAEERNKYLTLACCKILNHESSISFTKKMDISLIY